jgi:hypothetical protein
LQVSPAATDASKTGTGSAGSSDADASGARNDAPPRGTESALTAEGTPEAGESAATTGTDATGESGDGAVAEESAAESSADSSEASRASCLVTFTVAAAWIDGVVYQDVAVGGGVAELGGWSPQSAVAMTQVGGAATGTWTAGVVLTDGERVPFLFVKRGTGGITSWENWAPNSDRLIVVSCAADAGGAAADGGINLDIVIGDAGAGEGGPVVGVSYSGMFDTRPPDAT